MEGARPHVQLALRSLDPQAVGTHLLHVRRPLLDEHDVGAGGGEVRSDRGAVRTGAQHSDPRVAHS
jgi:hypothetical protein